MNKITSDISRPVSLGQHVIVDLFEAQNLFEAVPCAEILCAAAEAAGATVLETKLHDFGHRFGFTGVILLAESHISIHTWPENDYAAIDLFMCGDAQPLRSLDLLRAYFKPKREDVQVLHRGLMPAVAAL